MLMLRAGNAAVDAIRRHAGDRLARGVAVFVGTGNNGGDAWIVAGALRTQGVTVRVHATGEPATPDAIAARDDAVKAGAFDPPRGDEGTAVDGLLGTGASGLPRGATISALEMLATLRAQGAFVVALDVPSGMDSTTGDVPDLTVPADVTVTFGTLKRGLTIARTAAGAIEVVDIGLGAHADIGDGAPVLLDARAVHASVPHIDASAHKGTRGRVAIVGGSVGMAGAAVLAARGALRAGAGLVRLVVAPGSLVAVQSAVPEATGATWPGSSAEVTGALGTPDSLVIGPGLGAAERALVTLVLHATTQPAILDADALNAFAGDTAGLKAVIGVRHAVLTPHPAECGRLLGISTGEVLRDRFDAGLRLARATNAVVVLKGTPTVVSTPDGRVVVAPVGSPVLATGGSGDVLAGVTGVMLAVIDDALEAALAAVWAHGAAAEMVATSHIRGATLSDVVDALRAVWTNETPALPRGVLATLAAVGER
jgi:NAD(P)H-hydrate epimerase